jgi:hypothetical protein
MQQHTPLDTLPSAIIHIRLEPATDSCGNTVRQPDITQKPVVPLPIEHQWPVASKALVYLAVAVEVWSRLP